jgi:hypothetical protein
MAEFEADFQPPAIPGRPKAEHPVMCRECHAREAYDASCESCWSVDGDCCYCRTCGHKRLDQMAAGAIEIQERARTSGDRATIHGLNECDLYQLAHVLIDVILAVCEDTGLLVQAIRETHKFRMT